MASLVFASCGKIAFEDEHIDDSSQFGAKVTKTVTFSISEASETPDASRALSTNPKDRFTYLQYWIYDKDYNNVMASGVQNADSVDNFGTFTATLAYGTYNIVVVGHNHTSWMSLDKNGMVVIPETASRATDTYYGNAECVVAKGSASSSTITMARNMCNVYVTSNGSLANVGSCDVTVNAYGLNFRAKDGFSSSTKTKYSYTISINESQRKRTFVNFTIFFPMPNSDVNSDVSISLTAKDLNGNTLGSANITNVPAKAGRRVKYVRNLWSENAGIQVVVSDDDWEVVDGDV